MGAEDLCDQAMLMNHAACAVAALDPEVIEVGDGTGSGRSGAACLKVRCGRCML